MLLGLGAEPLAESCHRFLGVLECHKKARCASSPKMRKQRFWRQHSARKLCAVQQAEKGPIAWQMSLRRPAGPFPIGGQSLSQAHPKLVGAAPFDFVHHAPKTPDHARIPDKGRRNRTRSNTDRADRRGSDPRKSAASTFLRVLFLARRGTGQIGCAAIST